MIEYTKDRKLRVITLFSGYDSQCLALERLKRRYPDFDYELVAWCEIDRYACVAHDALFPESKGLNIGDISTVDWAQAPDCDLITWSFPCTDISSAGQQKGLSEGSGTRSSLAYEALKAIRIKRPKFALMENVKALISKMFKPDFERLMDELRSLGYTNYVPLDKNGDYTTLNAKDYGVPQNRERVFMVSILNGGLFEYHFPKPFPLTKRLKDVIEDDVDESYYLSDERVKGLIESTLKEKAAKRGFEFKPKSADDETANTLTGGCCTRKTDNFIAVGNSPDIANCITSHYAKEKTSDLVRGSFGGVLT